MTLLQKLQAGKIPLRELLDMARAPREDDVYTTRDTCTEVLRQLVGHIEALIGETMEQKDLRAGIKDLERRFEAWRNDVAERAEENSRFKLTAESMDRRIGQASNIAALASSDVQQLAQRLVEHFPTLDWGQDDD